MATNLARWSGNLKGHDWKISDKEIWRRDILVDFSEWAKNMKMFVPHMNAH